MTTRKLESSQWRTYFDDACRRMPATEVDLRVESSTSGDQVLFEHAILLGLDYDPNDHALEVATRHGSHRVSTPREVNVEESADGLHSVEIVDGEGRHHIVTLNRALALPPS